MILYAGYFFYKMPHGMGTDKTRSACDENIFFVFHKSASKLKIKKQHIKKPTV